MQAFVIGKLKAARPVVANSLYMLLPGLVNQMLAFFVLLYSGSGTWGQIVQWQLHYYLVTAIVAWGNKDFLLLAFSKHDQEPGVPWRQSLVSRGWLLLLPVLVVTSCMYPSAVAVHLCCWIVMRFFTQSFESIVVSGKKYNMALVSEVVAFLPLLLIVTDGKELGQQRILLILTLSHVLRAFVLVWACRGLLLGIRWRAADPRLLLRSGPFMMLAMAGFLQARADLYCVSLMSGKDTVGNYQVLMSYVSICLLVPGFLYTPYVRNFYEMTNSEVSRLQRRLNLTGIAAALPAVLAVAVLMPFVYRLEFGITVYLLAFAYVIAPYFFMPQIYALFRQGKQVQVMAVSFTGIGANVAACFLLVPGLGVAGALLANVLSQVVLFVLYRSVKTAQDDPLNTK